ncbi:MAG: hypothetical protein ACR2PL_01520, partial [Dehalococcoidia bacterium]
GISPWVAEPAVGQIAETEPRADLDEGQPADIEEDRASPASAANTFREGPTEGPTEFFVPSLLARESAAEDAMGRQTDAAQESVQADEGTASEVSSESVPRAVFDQAPEVESETAITQEPSPETLQAAAAALPHIAAEPHQTVGMVIDRALTEEVQVPKDQVSIDASNRPMVDEPAATSEPQGATSDLKQRAEDVVEAPEAVAAEVSPRRPMPETVEVPILPDTAEAADKTLDDQPVPGMLDAFAAVASVPEAE